MPFTTAADVRKLDLQPVLVRSSVDTHNPPVGMRGWLRVLDTGESTGTPLVEVVIEYPDMFEAPAHERILLLQQDQLERLLASERAGSYELTVDESLVPPTTSKRSIFPTPDPARVQ